MASCITSLLTSIGQSPSLRTRGHMFNHTARMRPACRLTYALTVDKLLAQLTGEQGIDRAVDRLSTDLGISEAGYAHAYWQSARETHVHAAYERTV